MKKENINNIFERKENSNFFLIAGPCVIEDRKITFEIAERLKSITENLNIPFIFKASFKKANRSKLTSFTGIGDEKALEILKEIDHFLNFNIIHLIKEDANNLYNKDSASSLIISNKKINNIKDQIIIDKSPVQISKLIEKINIKFLKKRFSQQSDIDIGRYKLNLNSRYISNSKKTLNLTERETNILLFLKNSKIPINVDILQKEVWGHNSKLETHTVETHIYRLRKKIQITFNDNNFIKSSKSGYLIK